MKSHKPQQKDAARPLAFRSAFEALWFRLFSTPKHLDSLLSDAPPSLKSTLAEVVPVMLKRPKSLANYLRVKLSIHEPWELDADTLAEWPAARVLADRVFNAWRKDPNFHEHGHAIPADYPFPMVDEWRREFGVEVMEELVATLAERAPLSLRASRRKGRDEVLSALNDSDELPMRAKASQHTPFGFYFPLYVPVMGHELFKKGAYEIQDEGSQLMSLFALWPEEFLPLLRKVPGSCRKWPKEREAPAPKKGVLTVIDTCAGAGGKTLALADALMGKGHVYAYDVSERKLQALKQRASRMELYNVKTLKLEDGKEAEAIKKFHASADVVLVDSPCSGWGVLRRNPDAKWRQDHATLDRLELIQARLLDTYAPLVKAGGTLTYGVCTFRKKETLEQVEKFLERHPEFISVGGGFYGPGPSDGFFFHAFRREK
jgi:16S rRNA C967 or C1407 C5-methylase (RsmB/RsmF family)